jgi:hypothetical protein
MKSISPNIKHCLKKSTPKIDKQVIDRADTDYMLYPLNEKPELNKQYSPQSKYEVKTLIIAAYADQTSGD